MVLLNAERCYSKTIVVFEVTMKLKTIQCESFKFISSNWNRIESDRTVPRGRTGPTCGENLNNQIEKFPEHNSHGWRLTVGVFRCLFLVPCSLFPLCCLFCWQQKTENNEKMEMRSSHSTPFMTSSPSSLMPWLCPIVQLGKVEKASVELPISEIGFQV